jgi:hypothetical protein
MWLPRSTNCGQLILMSGFANAEGVPPPLHEEVYYYMGEDGYQHCKLCSKQPRATEDHANSFKHCERAQFAGYWLNEHGYDSVTGEVRGGTTKSTAEMTVAHEHGWTPWQVTTASQPPGRPGDSGTTWKDGYLDETPQEGPWGQTSRPSSSWCDQWGGWESRPTPKWESQWTAQAEEEQEEEQAVSERLLKELEQCLDQQDHADNSGWQDNSGWRDWDRADISGWRD